MRCVLPATAAVATVLLAATLPAAADAAPSPYQPLAFLVGHCWKGTFPDGKGSDVHCFSWIYGGKFVRDEHVVHHGADRPDDYGESIYVWDAAGAKLEYLYIESAGGYSRGTVSQEPGALVFPPATYTEAGQSQHYRSRWQRSGSDAYDVITEFQAGDRWVPGFTVHMQQVRQ
jgi:hypothetical protein